VIDIAREHDVTIRLHVRPGEFVSAGTALMTVCAGSFASDWADGLFQGVVIIGEERTGTQDIGFFINQLVELAVRALSPGINDPATARSCIDRLEQALCTLASRRFPAAVRFDADRKLRVMACPVTFDVLVENAFAEIGGYGASSVTCRLLEAVRSIAACVTRDKDRRPLVEQAAAILERSRHTQISAGDRGGIEDRYEAARTALGGPPGRAGRGV
jgi:uncharacterized membrane protein